MKSTHLLLTIPAAAAVMSCNGDKSQEQPNIILIVADDLGLGDVSIYGSKTISTPNIDYLGNNGIRFDNAYATSATSTPSRYAMFTGMYPWRNADAKILPGDAPLLIPTDIPTMPKMMQDAGYNTAAIGKWHLGMGDGNVDWNKEIVPSANTVGFDYTCLIAATNDRVPTVYVEDGLVEGLDRNDPIYVSYKENFEGEPTALTNPEMLKMNWSDGHNCSIVNGIPRIGYMKGGEKARWTDEDMADYFIGKVKKFIDSQSADKPFFLYYGLHQPHVPRTPNARFVGSTTLGPRGDAVVEADWCVGELVKYLESKKILDNTLIIFTSDNGPVLDDGYVDFCVEMLGKHDPKNGTRGGKYSLYDGGTHIPMLFYWKGKITPSVSKAMVSQLDFFASLAEISGGKVPEGIDSQNHTDAFMGKSQTGRNNLISEAEGRLAYKSGNLVLIPPYNGPVRNNTMNELGNLGEWSLFDIEKDPYQTVNIISEHQEKAEELKREFRRIIGKKYMKIPGCDTMDMDLDDWTCECNSDKTEITCKDDTLDIVSPDGNTVWYRHRLEGNYRISYRITVVDAGGEYDRLSDLNCFWGAKDPEYPDDIFHRAGFRNGAFKNYNTLELFYVGFGGNENKTTRFRKYRPEYLDKDPDKVKPVLKEYDKLPNLLEKDKWYQIDIDVNGSETTYTIDGRTLFRHRIAKGECDGYFGLRFWKNHVRCTDFKIKKL